MPPGTVLRTESFDLANGYGFKVGSAQLRPKPNDTERDWHVWNSDMSATILQTVGGAHFVLLDQDEDPSFATCQRRSAYVDYLEIYGLDGRNICIYTAKGMIALMRVDSSTRLDQYSYNLRVTVTVWAA
ncbi:hypothetical protein ACF1BN_20305 [Streptomyces sp. NPDC014861]|uniref:hypothetical protein n=1 Tax=Streptomyces sp. NPDC014861 TaxID=3364923 RepID=UPI00370012C0